MNDEERTQMISSLKAKLESQESEIGDWKIIKYIEYLLTGEEILEDFLILHDKRQSVRNQINLLEETE